MWEKWEGDAREAEVSERSATKVERDECIFGREREKSERESSVVREGVKLEKESSRGRWSR